jgi:hypothetical protein
MKFYQWGTDIDDMALRQIEAASLLPISVAAALMPDAHVGYGLPIRGVLTTENAVVRREKPKVVVAGDIGAASHTVRHLTEIRNAAGGRPLASPPPRRHAGPTDHSKNGKGKAKAHKKPKA